MFAMTRLHILVAVIVGVAFAALLALAAFSSAEAAEQTDKKSAETTDTVGQEEPVGPITIENHSWQGFHWARTSNPFTLKLGDKLTSNWDPFLATTSSDWSQSSVMDTNVVPGVGFGRFFCNATSGQVKVCNAKYGRTGWVGIANVWVKDNVHITQATAKMNDTYFNTSQYNTTAWRNLVMCQEVGHALGLDHQDENRTNPNLGTCMDYTNDPSTNQHPNQHDYDQLETIYSHLDSTTTIDASTGSRMPSGNLNNPSGWGRSIFRSEDGRIELFERDLGRGEKLYTWVRWTEEEAAQRRS